MVEEEYLTVYSHRNYDSELCGVSGDRSPVWIANLGNYQVVTVFGTNKGKRQQFLTQLKEESDRYLQIFRLN